MIDENTCSILNKSIISTKFKIKNILDPCYKLKSIKNPSEIKNMIDTHIHDGVALTKFIYWMKEKNKKIITEIEAKTKLEKFRNLNKNYLRPSFHTISGTGANAAFTSLYSYKKK